MEPKAKRQKTSETHSEELSKDEHTYVVTMLESLHNAVTSNFETLCKQFLAESNMKKLKNTTELMDTMVIRCSEAKIISIDAEKTVTAMIDFFEDFPLVAAEVEKQLNKMEKP